MRYVYTWVPTGNSTPCACGGRLREYRVEPIRNPAYINHVLVCANPECKQAVSSDGRRKGRLIVA